jgi:hypothetical protein
LGVNSSELTGPELLADTEIRVTIPPLFSSYLCTIQLDVSGQRADTSSFSFKYDPPVIDSLEGVFPAAGMCRFGLHLFLLP